MSVITKLAEEVINMSDLAQAIVSLGRISERRRGARGDLIEATNTIAEAIREQLRTGDTVEVERHQELSLTGIVYGPGSVTYRATRVTRSDLPGTKPEDALVRENDGQAFVLGSVAAAVSYRTDQGHIALRATEEDRQAFVHEAPAVVAAFRKLLNDQADKYEAAAKKAAKLTPR